MYLLSKRKVPCFEFFTNAFHVSHNSGVYRLTSNIAYQLQELVVVVDILVLVEQLRG